MTINVIKFSQFAAGSLSNNGFSVGVTSLSGGTNYQQPDINIWNTAGRPMSPATGVLGYNTDLTQYEYWNGAAWVQFAAGGSGTVGLGAANELAYYQTSGTAVTGLMTANNSVVRTDGSGVPYLSTTLPTALTIPQPLIQGITNGTLPASGNVGEVITQTNTSGVSIPSGGVGVAILSLTLSAGNWMLLGWGSVDANLGMTNDQFFIGINTIPSIPAFSGLLALAGGSVAGAYTCSVIPQIVSITTSTTYYLVGASHDNSTSGFGSLSGLRVS